MIQYTLIQQTQRLNRFVGTKIEVTFGVYDIGPRPKSELWNDPCQKNYQNPTTFSLSEI